MQDFAIYTASGQIVRRGKGSAGAATLGLQPDEAIYWGLLDTRTHYLPGGVPTPKPDTTVITAALVKQHAGRLLSYSDWMVVRAMEGGTPVPAEVTAARAAIRAASNAIEAMHPIPTDFTNPTYWTAP